jgi:hypothetical protein
LTRQLLVRLVWLIGASVAIAALVVSVPAMDLQRGARAPVRHPEFRDVARAAGLDFVHVNGASDERFFPEIMGSGGLFLDFDNDGWLDIFLIDGGSCRRVSRATSRSPALSQPRQRLLRGCDGRRRYPAPRVRDGRMRRRCRQ